MTVAEACRQAAKAIRDRGHAKGHLEIDGRVCLIGAISLAVNGSPHPWAKVYGGAAVRRIIPAVASVHEWVAGESNPSMQWDDLVRWNNDQWCTAEEVIELLMAAADLDDVENGRVPL